MQGSTKPTETPKITKYADVKYTPDTLQKLDARRIIFAAVCTQSPKQYVDLFYFERGKLRRLHASRKDHKALYLNARDYVLKNRELFDELYIGQEHFIYVKKFIEVRPNPRTRSLDYLRNNQTFAGPKFEFEQYTMLEAEIGRREIYTIDLCSADFLDSKIQTRKIIRRYFGAIGFKYYRRTAACGKRILIATPMQRFAQMRHHTDLYPFTSELNQIPINTLIEPNFTDEIAKLPDDEHFEEKCHKFIYNRYYYSLIDSREELLLIAIIHLLVAPIERLESIFTPEHWVDALNYIRFTNQEYFVVSEEQNLYNVSAYNYYRARYILNKLGRTRTKSLLNRFFALNKISQNADRFTEVLDEALGEPVDQLFLKANRRKTSATKLKELGDLFTYPCIVNFDKVSDRALLTNISQIAAEQLTDARLCAIAYYFANFWFLVNTNKANPLDATYAASHILRVAPQFSKEASWAIFYAGDIFSLIERGIPYDNRKLLLCFETFLHEQYWRILNHNISFLQNYRKTEFMNEHHQAILDEAIDWESYLKNLPVINPELDQYYDELSKADIFEAHNLNLPNVIQAAHCRHAQKLKPNERLDFFLSGDQEDLLSYYTSDLDLEDAKILMPYLLTPQCEIEDKLILIEDLASSGNNPEIGAYVINYLADHLTEAFRQLRNSETPSGQYWTTRIFCAFCDGASHEIELTALENFATKLSAALIQSGQEHEYDSYLAKINLAFASAQHHVTEQQELRSKVSAGLPSILHGEKSTKDIK